MVLNGKSLGALLGEFCATLTSCQLRVACFQGGEGSLTFGEYAMQAIAP
jgi:hypothetical protein